MDNQLGLDLLTNRKKLKKTNLIDSFQNKELISENHSPIVLDSIIKDLINTLSQIVKYRYHIKTENEKIVKDIINELLPLETKNILQHLELNH